MAAMPDPKQVQSFLATARRVIETEAAALGQMAADLPADFDDAVAMILAAPGRVIVSGMGKSGHVARKIAATLASTGTPAIFVHPAEASHGDLGMITKGDVCLMLSNSGETAELKDMIAYASRFDIPIIAMTKVPASTLGHAADLILGLPDAPEACSIGRAPTTSTTASMALGDALAVVLMEAHDFREETFKTYHPGGKLGAQLLRVRDIMHGPANVATAFEDTPMGEVVVEITAKGLGTAAVLQGDRLVGGVTDGDIRRNLDGLMDKTAGAIASRNPRVIAPDALAAEAVAMMNEGRVTALFVASDGGRFEGLIHLKDCLSAGVV